jgi:hypothetical protein
MSRRQAAHVETNQPHGDWKETLSDRHAPTTVTSTVTVTASGAFVRRRRAESRRHAYTVSDRIESSIQMIMMD